MRMFAGVLLIALVSAPAAQAQAPARPAAGAKPAAGVKPAGAVTPSVQQTYAAMPLAEREAIQAELIWTDDYNGLVDGDFNTRTVEAVKAFQKRNRGKETGVLNLQERALLAAAAKSRRDFVGWRVIPDPVTGARFGLPGKLVQPVPASKDSKEAGRAGSRWSSGQGQIQIETFRIAAPETSLQAVFEREKKEPSERRVSYQALRGDFFVVSGTQNLKKFYIRAQIKEGEVRGIRLFYDPANEGIMDRVAVAMSSAFEPFPDGGLPPRRLVDYGSGIAIGGNGEILTERALVDGCQVITVAGLGAAERVSEDEGAGLALLRVYGARHLRHVLLGPAAAGPVTLVGLADPQLQAGGSAVSALGARLSGSEGPRAIDPAPGPGFAGAAVLDPQHRLVGIVSLKVPLVAGTAPARAQAEALPVESVRGWTAGADAAATDAADLAADPKDAVARVICVRK